MNLKYWIRHPVIFTRRVWHFFYEKLYPDEPFLAPAAVRFLDESLPRNGIDLEWGSGRSTRWFAQRLRRLVAVEYDDAWAERVKQQIKESAICNVDLRVIRVEHPLDEPTRPIYDPVPRYIAFVDEFPDEHFDFIEVDGHYRQACVVMALRKLKKRGLLLVDDTNWLPLEAWGVPSSW